MVIKIYKRCVCPAYSQKVSSELSINHGQPLTSHDSNAYHESHDDSFPLPSWWAHCFGFQIPMELLGYEMNWYLGGGRWIHMFFLFSPLLGEMIQFDEHFSDWLKLPTRNDMIWNTITTLDFNGFQSFGSICHTGIILNLYSTNHSDIFRWWVLT